MRTVSLIVGVIALIFGVGYFVTGSDDGPNVRAPEVVEAERSLSSGPESAERASGAEGTAGTYQDYDAEKVAQSDAEHIFLFFHATWCPSCRALDADIVANAETIPTDVEIYKVDYDTATDLKRQYGVTTQHSIIAITATGEAISDINHPLTLEGVLAII